MTSSMKLLRRYAMAVKLQSLLLVLTCEVLAAPGAWADNCRLSVSRPSIDYGAIRHQPALAETSPMAIATRSLLVNVVCTEPAALGLRFIGIAADGQGFRFGQGRFRLTLKQARVDGHAVGWVAAHMPGEPVGGQLLPGHTLMARVAGMPMLGRRLSAQVDIDTELPAGALDVRNETRLEGQGSFELISSAVPPSR